MKRVLTLICASIVLIVTGVAAHMGSCAQSNSPVAGNWELEVETPQGKQAILVTFLQEGSQLSATLKSLQGERRLENVAVTGSIRGNDISFSMRNKNDSNDSPISYKGTVARNSMKGKVDFPGHGSAKWQAKRQETEEDAAAQAGSQLENVNITGQWKFIVETAGGTGRPTFVFKQEGESLTGTYDGPLGHSDVMGSIKDGKATFSISATVEGQQYRVTYKGKVLNDKNMKGTVQFGDNAEGGEGTWTGKKS
jgi:hypothetical protein